MHISVLLVPATHITIYRSNLVLQTDLIRFIDRVYEKSLQYIWFAQSIGDRCIFYSIYCLTLYKASHVSGANFDRSLTIDADVGGV